VTQKGLGSRRPHGTTAGLRQVINYVSRHATATLQMRFPLFWDARGVDWQLSYQTFGTVRFTIEGGADR